MAASFLHRAERVAPDTSSADGFILIVDDEADIRALLTRVLSERGCSVLSATDGEDALEQMARGVPIRFVISNLRMPRMNGPSLYLCVGVACPALAERFVFCTGDVVSDNCRYFLLEARRPCLSKPFELEEIDALLRALADVVPIRLDAAAILRVTTILGKRQKGLALVPARNATA